eukprot:symbB.v1.2.017345.t1/scaffold1353.1/size123746/7
MLAISPCFRPLQRHLGRRAELQEQHIPTWQVSASSCSSRPRGTAPALELEVCLVGWTLCASSRRRRQGQRDCAECRQILMRSVEKPNQPSGSPEDNDTKDPEDTKQKLLQRLRQEVSGSHLVVARIFLSASSDLRHEMLELIAEETMSLPVENFRWLLRASWSCL